MIGREGEREERERKKMEVVDLASVRISLRKEGRCKEARSGKERRGRREVAILRMVGMRGRRKGGRNHKEEKEKME